MSNIYIGELVGIQIAMEFLIELEYSDLKESYMHIFTDCQHDTITEFENEIQTSKIDIVTRN